MADSSRNSVRLLNLWASPFGIRARIALHIKGVKYELVEENLSDKSKLLLESNPVHKKVPVLIHGDKIVCESLVIVQYVDEFWNSGHALLSSDPYNRAVSRFWGAYVDEKLFPAIRGVLAAKDEATKRGRIEAIIQSLDVLEEALKKCSKERNGSFFEGERIGYLDIAVGGFLKWLKVTEKMNNVKLLDESKIPALVNWAGKFASDCAVKDYLPETDKLVGFAKVLSMKLQKVERLLID